MDWLNALQWPAMAVTVAAAWWVGSRQAGYRKIGVYLFLVSNVLWVVWGWYSSAWALIVLQFALATINFRNVEKNDDGPGRDPDRAPA